MSQYRRLCVPGGTYFFTVRLADRRSDLLTREIGLLRDCTALCKTRWPFNIDAAVVLPDHLHMIWTLPAEDGDFSKRWRLIKSTFSRHLPAPEHADPSKLRAVEKGIWQRRFWEHLIRDDTDLANHQRLIAEVPIRMGLAAGPYDWPYTSVHRDRRHGSALAIRPTAGFLGSSESGPALRLLAG